MENAWRKKSRVCVYEHTVPHHLALNMKLVTFAIAQVNREGIMLCGVSWVQKDKHGVTLL